MDAIRSWFVDAETKRLMGVMSSVGDHVEGASDDANDFLKQIKECAEEAFKVNKANVILRIRCTALLIVSGAAAIACVCLNAPALATVAFSVSVLAISLLALQVSFGVRHVFGWFPYFKKHPLEGMLQGNDGKKAANLEAFARASMLTGELNLSGLIISPSSTAEVGSPSAIINEEGSPLPSISLEDAKWLVDRCDGMPMRFCFNAPSSLTTSSRSAEDRQCNEAVTQFRNYLENKHYVLQT